MLKRITIFLITLSLIGFSHAAMAHRADSKEELPYLEPSATGPSVWDGMTELDDAHFFSGAGTSTEPYLIQSATDLAQLAAKVAGGNSYSGVFFSLTTDVVLCDIPLGDVSVPPPDTNQWNPIGVSKTLSFKGNFDGHNHLIDGICIDGPNTRDYCGLFGYISNGTITNVQVRNCFISGNMHVGTIVGRLDDSFVANVDVAKSTVQGRMYVGGIAGSASNTVNSSCSVTDSGISGSKWVGGIIGYLTGGSFSDGFNDSFVDGTENVGGIVGYIVNTTITNSENRGPIQGQNYTGGIVGYSSTVQQPAGVKSIQECCNKGPITGKQDTGGIAGYITTAKTQIKSCFNEGDIIASGNYCGGLVGQACSGSSLFSSFNIGNVNGTSGVGGLLGYNNDAQITHSYNGGSVSGGETVGGLVGWILKNRLDSCYNTGEVSASNGKVGAIAGELGQNGALDNCFFDHQMSPVAAIGIGGDAGSGQAEGQDTLGMVGDGLKDYFGDQNWVFTADLYPRLRGLDQLDESLVYAAPVFLSEGDDILAVIHNFHMSTPENVKWATDNDQAVMVTGGQAIVTRTLTDESVTLTARQNTASRKVNIIVKARTSQQNPDLIRLQLNGIAIKDKIYDGLVGAIWEGQLDLQPGPGQPNTGEIEDVALEGAPNINFIDPEAGEHKGVTVTGLTLTGSKAHLYELDFSNLTGTINPKPVILSWTDLSDFIYDNTRKTVHAAVSNAEAGDEVEVADYEGTTWAIDAGTYNAAAIKLSNKNYTLSGASNTSVQWAITRAPLTITLADKTASQTGHPITADAPIVGPVPGVAAPDDFAFSYFIDPACTIPTYAGTPQAGLAPRDIGTYYVVANFMGNCNFAPSSSPVATLKIKRSADNSNRGPNINRPTNLADQTAPDGASWPKHIVTSDWYAGPDNYAFTADFVNGIIHSQRFPYSINPKAVVVLMLWYFLVPYSR